MKIKKRYMAAFVICVMMFVRIIYVNIVYDKPVSIHNEIGEVFTYGDKFEIRVDSLHAYTKEQWNERLEQEGLEAADMIPDFLKLVVEYCVTNISDEEATFDGSCVYAQIGTAFDGTDMGNTAKLSGGQDAISSTYKSGQTRTIKQVYTIDMGLIRDKKILSRKIQAKICEYSAIHTITN